MRQVLDILSRVNDSKKLSSQQREALYEELTSAKFKGRIAWSVAEASVTEIDSSNILQASLSAMAKAVRGLSASAMESLVVLVDGCNRPPELLAAGEKWTRLSQRDREALKNQTKLSRWFAQKEKQEKEEPWRPKDVEAVVEGDGRVPSISAASVLAKVYRDRRMEALDEVHPGYDFKTHKGYGTEAHLKAIKLHGICPEHRRSFEPVRQALVTEGQGLEPTKREKRDKRESDCDSESKRGWLDLPWLKINLPTVSVHGNVSQLANTVKGIYGWQYYFAEVAIIEGRILLRRSDAWLGGWLLATLRLIDQALHLDDAPPPDVLFVLSVHDEAHLEKARFNPLPLLSALATRAHWDIPIPGQTWYEAAGGVSSQDVEQNFGLWESAQWQASLEETYPWKSRSPRAFFRGHDWASSNAFTEFLPDRPQEACIAPHDVSMSFSYRRMYAELSQGELQDLLDVGLTGAPKFVQEQHPKQSYVRPVSLPEHAQYKFLLHLDGTAASNRLLKLLFMGSVVLKQDSVYEEFFYKDLKPWVHFVPISRDRCSFTWPEPEPPASGTLTAAAAVLAVYAGLQ
ncbi:rnhB, partial [Symbiodinium pilosum]